MTAECRRGAIGMVRGSGIAPFDRPAAPFRLFTGRRHVCVAWILARGTDVLAFLRSHQRAGWRKPPGVWLHQRKWLGRKLFDYWLLVTGRTPARLTRHDSLLRKTHARLTRHASRQRETPAGLRQPLARVA